MRTNASHYDPADLNDLPTLATGQAADLKIDTGTVRVWLSRCGPADGEDQPVQVEILRDGRWIDADEEGDQ
jgi:hypothetical protein